MCAQHFFRFSVGVVIFALSAPLGTSLWAQQNTGELDVGVRTQVDPTAKFEKKIKGQKPEPRPRLYAILQVQLRPNDQPLVRPVDPEMIAREIAQQLDAQGFVRTQPKQKPEMVITAEFGRGMLPNPYLGGDQVLENAETGLASVTASGLGFLQLMRQKTVGYEAKLQKASYEKLYIEVKAWQYPTSPQENPRVLWVAMMNVDDPDNRDLNTICREMLAAGGPYFDRAVDQPEVDVFKPLPEGTVKVGTPTVVEPTKAEAK